MGVFMRNIKNSYFLAILKATDNGKFPEYSDLWRCYHPTAMMLDSDYCLFTIPSRFELTRNEEVKTGSGLQKILYVPVTRKVTDTDDSKASKMYSGMIQK